MKRCMNLKYLPASIAFFCLSLPMITGIATAQVTLLSPRDNSFVEAPLITLVAKTALKDAKVSINGRDLNIKGIVSGNFHLSFSGVRLSPGRNSIKISVSKDGTKVEEATSILFFRSDLSISANSPPAGFARYYFHAAENERLCTPCHRLNFAGIPENPSGPDQSPCYICHKTMLTSYRFVHGPAAVWSCTSCHEAGKKGRKLATMKPDERICSGCHEYNWMNKKFIHGPTAAGGCTTCHNPHAANESSFLRMNTADLCVACHDDIITKPHVISGFSGNSGHPVRLSPDPLNPERDFTCASCHNPHATDFPLMLKSDYNSMYQYCQACHKM